MKKKLPTNQKKNKFSARFKFMKNPKQFDDVVNKHDQIAKSAIIFCRPQKGSDQEIIIIFIPTQKSNHPLSEEQKSTIIKKLESRVHSEISAMFKIKTIKSIEKIPYHLSTTKNRNN